MKNCIMVGDKETDLLAGIRADVGQSFIVRTGHKVPDSLMNDSFVLTNVVEYLKMIVVVHNIIAPYRTPLFNKLSQRLAISQFFTQIKKIQVGVGTRSI